MEIVFTSERLLFRKFTEEDSLLIYELNSDPLVTEYVHEEPTTKEKAEEIIRNSILPQYQLYNHGRWAVHLKSTNEFIGWCGLKYRPEFDKIDLGYRFMQKYWGFGYATEAAKRTIQFGFENLHLKEIFGDAHVENNRSLKVLEKAGMQFIKFATVDNCPVQSFKISNPNI
jgi:RimJ/RimL family protein N-acetyltransferase